MSEEIILDKVRDVLKEIKNPRTHESAFIDITSLSFRIENSVLIFSLSGNDAFLHNSILIEQTNTFCKIPGISDVRIMIGDTQKYKFPNIKKIIIIASGKGGVGKSTIAANIAVQMAKRYKVGLLDADIYGPSISRLMGDFSAVTINENNHLIPIVKHNIKFISAQCFVNDKASSFIWRGPMLVKMLYKMLCNTIWGELDYLIIDTPPGTGDIHISLCKNFHIDGAILCTMPQILSIDAVKKACNMFFTLGVKILGLIENMSYFIDDLGYRHYVFGQSQIFELEKYLNMNVTAKLPIIPELAKDSDFGNPSVCKNGVIEELFEKIVFHIEDVI